MPDAVKPDNKTLILSQPLDGLLWDLDLMPEQVKTPRDQMLLETVKVLRKEVEGAVAERTKLQLELDIATAFNTEIKVERDQREEWIVQMQGILERSKKALKDVNEKLLVIAIDVPREGAAWHNTKGRLKIIDQALSSPTSQRKEQ